MNAVADKYIAPSGRTAAYDRSKFSDDLVTAASFLVFAEQDGAWFGGYQGNDAFIAMCRMLDMDPIHLRKIVLGAYT